MLKEAHGRHTAGRYGAPPSVVTRLGVTALLCAPALFVALLPDTARALELDRARLAVGEVWRLLTCHWVHWSLDHLVWDLAAFAVLTFLALRHGVARLLGTLGFAAVAIGVTIWTALPSLSAYRGLSGLDSALYVLVGVTLLREEVRGGSRALWAVFVAALLAFVAKVLFEVATGSTVFVASDGFVPVPLAHLVGAVIGAVAALRRCPPPCLRAPRCSEWVTGRREAAGSRL